MSRIFTSMTSEHEFIYVFIASFILLLCVSCGGIVFHRALSTEEAGPRRRWATVAGVVAGLGVWAAHHISMMGYRPGVSYVIDGTVSTVSALISISGFILVGLVLSPGMTPLRRAGATLLATLTTGCMHFFAMRGIRANAEIEIDPAYMTASVLGGFILFGLGFGLAREHGRLRVVIASCGIFFAVIVMHYVAMAGMVMVPEAAGGFEPSGWVMDSLTLSEVVIMGCVLTILAAAMAAGLDSTIQRLRSREQHRIGLLVNAASEAILIIDPQGKIVEVNAGAEALFGQSREALLGETASHLVHADLSSLAKSSDPHLREHYMKTGGKLVPVDLSIRDLGGKTDGLFVVSLYDLRERLRHEADIRKLAYRDQLTGLLNRAAFQKALNEFCKGTKRSRTQFGVFLIDLDEFKDINDQFGHAAGDQVLVRAAERLRKTFDKQALIARLGGDEFAVIVPQAHDEEQLLALGQACVKNLSIPTRFGTTSVRPGASIGIAIAYSQKGLHVPSSLLKAADRALYSSKEKGRRTFSLYDKELHQRTEQKRKLEADLVRAVQNEEFILHYQAKVDTSTRRILGFEALIRWNRPGYGLVYPKAFIEIAEQSLIIQDIGRWCIHEACKAAAAWENDVAVSVNLSARQFMDPALYSTVRDALRQSGLSADRLELEITETALIQNTVVAARILEKLKILGVKIALDDFGTGYSSMQFVQQFPFDRIKIDRSFVATMGNDKKAFAIVDAILHLGASLSIPVVAEGVETEEQARRLQDIHCSELQGFLISPPGPFPEDVLAIPQMAANAS